MAWKWENKFAMLVGKTKHACFLLKRHGGKHRNHITANGSHGATKGAMNRSYAISPLFWLGLGELKGDVLHLSHRRADVADECRSARVVHGPCVGGFPKLCLTYADSFDFRWELGAR